MNTINGFQGISSLTNNSSKDVVENPKAVLGKDDFMKLLLIELKYQDPTQPTDTEKILTQTSQLATLESANNTNKELEKLSKTISNSAQLTSISTIGKMGSLGTNSILLDETNEPQFEIYFPKDVSSGTITIKDSSGNVVRTFDIANLPSGVNPFSWDGTNDVGDRLKAGLYSIEASYTSSDGSNQTAAYGVYPIESVRFEKGEAKLKLGSSYIPLKDVVEIY